MGVAFSERWSERVSLLRRIEGSAGGSHTERQRNGNSKGPELSVNAISFHL